MIVFRRNESDKQWLFKRYDKLPCKSRDVFVARSHDGWSQLLANGKQNLKTFLLKEAIMNPEEVEEVFVFADSWLKKMNINEFNDLDLMNWPVYLERDMLEPFICRGSDE